MKFLCLERIYTGMFIVAQQIHLDLKCSIFLKFMPLLDSKKQLFNEFLQVVFKWIVHGSPSFRQGTQSFWLIKMKKYVASSKILIEL